MARIAVFKGNPFAKAAVETAWWALDSKLKDIPLWQSLGATDPTVACGADFGVQDTMVVNDLDFQKNAPEFSEAFF